MQNAKPINYRFLFTLLALVAFGLVSLYSASTVKSFENFGNTSYYIIHQFLYGVLAGGIGLFILSKIDYHKWQKFVPYILILAVILLVLVKVPGIGFSSGGASRWIHFGPIFFQPSEFAKLAIIIYLAAHSAKNTNANSGFIYSLLPPIIIVGVMSLLILAQPDFGTMSIILCISAIILFASGMKFKHFLILGALGIIALMLLIKFEPYRYERLASFMNPSADKLGSSYQINQALLGIGGGGIWGYGYGLSRQKYNYLPEPMNDSIFAITAEELGFVRTLALLVLYLALILQGLKISTQAPDKFGKLLALGIISWFGVQAAINITALTGLIPLTGVPLPFFSYGSSALITALAGSGILLNISRHYKG